MISRYSRPEMARLWSEESKYASWLEVELAACDAMAAPGQGPRGGAGRAGRGGGLRRRGVGGGAGAPRPRPPAPPDDGAPPRRACGADDAGSQARPVARPDAAQP